MTLRKSLILFFICFAFNIFSQEVKVKTDTLTIAFWNMENLFDTIDDLDKNDNEFTPDGAKKWTNKRLLHKLENMSAVIKMMGSNGGPDILGMCEVEHQTLVDMMLSKFLKEKNYGVAYKESPDKRGIDNGLIYNKDEFSLISVEAILVELPTHYPTRDILQVLLKAKNNDSIYVFVNHWPSRSGGQLKSEKNRFQAALTLKNQIEELLSINSNLNILVMGDFNDTPTDRSFIEILKAEPVQNYLMKNADSSKVILYNLSYENAIKGNGTYKYRKQWNMLDQFLITKNMFLEKGITYLLGSFQIFSTNMIIEQTGKYKGSPFRTFGGENYLGGYSDHFPILAKFILN